MGGEKKSNKHSCSDKTMAILAGRSSENRLDFLCPGGKGGKEGIAFGGSMEEMNVTRRDDVKKVL